MVGPEADRPYATALASFQLRTPYFQPALPWLALKMIPQEKSNTNTASCMLSFTAKRLEPAVSPPRLGYTSNIEQTEATL
jgi:hypothetical protein